MSRNCFLMTWKAVKLTTRIGFVRRGAFEFTLRAEAIVAALIILKADVFHRGGKSVVGWIDRRSGADYDVSPHRASGNVTRDGGIAFAKAVAQEVEAVRSAIRDVFRVDEAGRGFAVQRHDVAVLEVRVVTQSDVVIVRHRQKTIHDAGEQVVGDLQSIRALRNIRGVFA